MIRKLLTHGVAVAAGAAAGYVVKEIEQYKKPTDEETERMWRGRDREVTFNETQQDFILDDIDFLLSDEEDGDVEFGDGTKLSDHHRFFEQDLRDIRRDILHADKNDDGSVTITMTDRQRLTMYDFILSPLLKQRERVVGGDGEEE